MAKKSKMFMVFTTVVLISGSLGFAIAAPAQTSTIYACLSSSGSLSKVSLKSIKCPKGTSQISWNQSGPTGKAGIQGVQGAQGARGVPGLQGAQGPQGLPGESAPSMEVTIFYNDSGVEKSSQTSLNGRFLEVGGVLWPLVWGTGAYLPELGSFRTVSSDGETIETLAFSGLGCSGIPHAIIGVRNNVDRFDPEEILSSEWVDDMPPVPLNNEVRAIRGEFFKVTENTFARELIRSFRDENGFCRTGKPFSDLYKKQVFTEVEVGEDEWGDPIYENELVGETPLFFVKVQLLESIPEITRTSEILEFQSK